MHRAAGPVLTVSLRRTRMPEGPCRDTHRIWPGGSPSSTAGFALSSAAPSSSSCSSCVDIPRAVPGAARTAPADMDLVLEDIEDEKPAVAEVGSGPARGGRAAGEPGAAPGAPRAQGRYLPLLQKDSLERVLGLICDVLEVTPDALPGLRRPLQEPGAPPAAPADNLAPAARPALPEGPPAPALEGGTGEPGAVPSLGCSLLSCEERAEIVLAASPCCDAEGTQIGEQAQAGAAGKEERQVPPEEPAETPEEPAEAAGEPMDAWKRKVRSQPSVMQLGHPGGCAAQHDLPLWPEPLGDGAIPALQLSHLLASLQPGEQQELEEEVLQQEVLQQSLFSRAKKLFDSQLRSSDSSKAPAPAHEDMLKQLILDALQKTSMTPAQTWAPSTPEHPHPVQPDLPPSFLQRMMQKLGLKILGRREAQKP
ncbi:skin secretory protein xP2-like [Struthio camelus]|uniref:skin secretory protein xP2-like n=1 Tax=Struthio camelus TaxID=8801 RepID=UPI003603E7BA